MSSHIRGHPRAGPVLSQHLIEPLERRQMLAAAAVVEDLATEVAAPRPSRPVVRHPHAGLPNRLTGKAAVSAVLPRPISPEDDEVTGLAGDLNGDYAVDDADFKIFFANFGGAGRANGDVNRDGAIDFADFQLMEQNFGVRMTPPPPPPPPPPATNDAYIGTNVDGISDWGTIGAFTNLARTFRPWGTADLPYTPDPNLPLTPDGY